jgi:hypothetical protein
LNKPDVVYFFNNGNSAVCSASEQIPELQESWLVLFVRHLETCGVDPTGITFHLPAGDTATLFRTTGDGWNWEIKT